MKKTRTIKVSEYYCDRCGEQLLGYDEAEFYVDADIWEEHSDEVGWREIDGKHYCPDCWHYNDDDDPEPITPPQQQ